MPIYAYRCDSCGFEKDHLQKLSDATLRVCPQCAQATYSKQVTAAGFQLKGNGWYATDFKNDAKKAPTTTKEKPESPEIAPAPVSTGSTGATDATGASTCAGS